jgi:hypothetical protein
MNRVKDYESKGQERLITLQSIRQRLSFFSFLLQFFWVNRKSSSSDRESLSVRNL